MVAWAKTFWEHYDLFLIHVFIMFGETQSHAQSIHVSFMKFLMYSQIDDLPQEDVKNVAMIPKKV